MSLFDDLPDLVFIELFNYLSSTDILWAFGDFSDRLRAIVFERGFFRHINLSQTHLHQFDTVLRLLPLANIESLVIDSYASPLQLTRWPYLPRLITLRLKGLREFEDVCTFVLRHAATLVNLTFETNGLHMSVSVTR